MPDDAPVTRTFAPSSFMDRCPLGDAGTRGLLTIVPGRRF
jgi:hypothetical protein